jgi:hypothetical protein
MPGFDSLSDAQRNAIRIMFSNVASLQRHVLKSQMRRRRRQARLRRTLSLIRRWADAEGYPAIKPALGHR